VRKKEKVSIEIENEKGTRKREEWV
jgi:hypothetical protein